MSQHVSKEAVQPSTYNADGETHGHSGERFWILALGSIGVVFGDIGTSPLYALQTALGQIKRFGAGRG